MTDTVTMIHSTALREAAPTIRHAFFTRRGGVSTGIYAALNVGFGSDDRREHVVENRRRAMAALDLPASALTTLYQVHGADVVIAESGGAKGEPAPKADALVTTEPGVALGILTADCVPVLFADRRNGVIGAAHSGWKGAESGVLEATVTTMIDLGAQRANIVAAVGPAIAQNSYEVGPAFPEPFLAKTPDNRRFFKPSQQAGRFMFDLTGFVEASLQVLELGGVEHVEHDTYAEPDAFFSYRRATHQGEPDYGRGLSAIALFDD
jgi:polyphenol oxidase